MITTVIFDLDGLLADTERLHKQSYQEVFKQYGVEVSDTDYVEFWIRTGKGTAGWLQKEGLTLEHAEIRRQKNLLYPKLVKSFAKPMNGALAVLDRLSGTFRLALASASYRDSVHCVIEHLGIVDYFELVTTRNDVVRSKPFPDIFLYVAEKLGVEPAQCVVLEDSERGVLAAKEAGMHCLAIPNEYTRHHNFTEVTKVLSSLDDVTVELLNTL